MRSSIGACAVAVVGSVVIAAVPAAAGPASPAGPAAPANHAAPAAGTRAAGTFVSLERPERLLDTRKRTGGSTPGPRGTVHLQVAGKGSVPSGVSAVMLNVTAVAPGASGFLTVYADGAKRPAASNLNFVKGRTVANLVVAPLNTTTGRVALYNDARGSVPLAADVSGYYVGGTPTVAGSFTSLTPARILDTRVHNGGSTPRTRGTVQVQVSGKGGVPSSGVSAVILNVTVTAPTGGGYLTVYGSGQPRPTASNLNFARGQTVPNLVVAPVGSDGKVAVYNAGSGSTPLVADVAGYFRSGSATAAGAFKLLPPSRVLDTRRRLGATRPAARGDAHVPVYGSSGDAQTSVPESNVAAVVMNVTVPNASADGYVEVYVADQYQVRPTASTVNFVRGQTVANLAFARVSSISALDLYNGSTRPNHLLGDIAGYFIGDVGAIRGTVTDASTGAPIAGIQLYAYDEGPPASSGDATTDDDGHYNIRLDPHTYEVCFNTGDPLGRSADGYNDGYESPCVKNVVVNPGQTVTVDEALAPR